jgi:hypothetical protein
MWVDPPINGIQPGPAAVNALIVQLHSRAGLLSVKGGILKE